MTKRSPLQWRTDPNSHKITCHRDGLMRFVIGITEPVGGVVKWTMLDLKTKWMGLYRSLAEAKVGAREIVKAERKERNEA